MTTFLVLMMVPPAVFWAVYIIREPWVWSKLTRKSPLEFLVFSLWATRDERQRAFDWFDLCKYAWQDRLPDVYYDSVNDEFYNTGEALPASAIPGAGFAWFVEQAVEGFGCIGNGHDYQTIEAGGQVYGPVCTRCPAEPGHRYSSHRSLLNG